jgi:hypothetical protein
MDQANDVVALSVPPVVLGQVALREGAGAREPALFDLLVAEPWIIVVVEVPPVDMCIDDAWWLGLGHSTIPVASGATDPAGPAALRAIDIARFRPASSKRAPVHGMDMREDHHGLAALVQHPAGLVDEALVGALGIAALAGNLQLDLDRITDDTGATKRRRS